MENANIASILDELGLKYTYNDHGDFYLLGFNLNSKLNKCDVFLRATDSNIVALGLINFRATDDVSKMAVAEYLTRANFGLLFGNFEFDFNDGEIRYQIAQNFISGITLSAELVNFMISIVVSMVEKYGDGLASVLFGGAKPYDAICEIDNSKE